MRTPLSRRRTWQTNAEGRCSRLDTAGPRPLGSAPVFHRQATPVRLIERCHDASHSMQPLARTESTWDFTHLPEGRESTEPYRHSRNRVGVEAVPGVMFGITVGMTTGTL